MTQHDSGQCGCTASFIPKGIGKRTYHKGSIEVPLPPIDRQREFGEMIRRIRPARAIDQQTAAFLEALKPAPLNKAFRGEL